MAKFGSGWSKKGHKISRTGEIFPYEEVKAYQYGDNLEFVTRPMAGRPASIMRLDSEHYVDANGEVKDYHKSTTKDQNLASVAKTMKRLRRLIANNFDGGNDQLWLTLTYAENMTDEKRLLSDFKLFIRKLRRHVGHVEYIMVIEPQLRGAWHCHLLIKSDDGSDLTIPNSDVANIWGHGFTKTKRLRESDNVAAYVTAYLSDIPIDQITGASKSKEHKIAKGARLNLYPAGVHFYRFSQGIDKPSEEVGAKGELMKAYGVTEDDSVFYHQRTIPISMKIQGIDSEEEVVFKTEIYRTGLEGDKGDE